MEKIKDSLKSTAHALFPVNPFAGKLRAVLFCLVVFIFWTLNAQNLTGAITTLFNPFADGRFIANILGDLIGRYFHPVTLLLTFAPVLLFSIARRQAATFLSRVFEEDQKSTLAYLARSAFSTNPLTVDAAGSHEKPRPDQPLNRLKTLGGPAKIRLSSSDMLIINTGGTDCFQLISTQGQGNGWTYQLEHRQKLTAVAPRASLQFLIQVPKDRDPIQITILHPRPLTSQDNMQSITQQISQGDVQFLLAARNPDALLIPFFHFEIDRFSRQQENIFKDENPQSLAPSALDRKTARKNYSNYAQLAIITKPSRNLRPRKHARYTAARMQNSASRAPNHQPAAMRDGMIDALEAHLQRELVSFFHLTHIHITIKK